MLRRMSWPRSVAEAGVSAMALVASFRGRITCRAAFSANWGSELRCIIGYIVHSISERFNLSVYCTIGTVVISCASANTARLPTLAIACYIDQGA